MNQNLFLQRHMANFLRIHGSLTTLSLVLRPFVFKGPFLRHFPLLLLFGFLSRRQLLSVRYRAQQGSFRRKNKRW